MRVLAVGLMALLAGPVAAEAVKLDGAGITKALVGVALVYDDGTSQSFAGDGGTVFDGGNGASNGRWRVSGDQYCSEWPPSDSWACYDVTVDGRVIAFVAADGSASVGRVKN